MCKRVGIPLQQANNSLAGLGKFNVLKKKKKKEKKENPQRRRRATERSRSEPTAQRSSLDTRDGTTRYRNTAFLGFTSELFHFVGKPLISCWLPAARLPFSG